MFYYQLVKFVFRHWFISEIKTCSVKYHSCFQRKFDRKLAKSKQTVTNAIYFLIIMRFSNDPICNTRTYTTGLVILQASLIYL